MTRYRWIEHNGKQILIGIQADGIASCDPPGHFSEDWIRAFFFADAEKRAAERRQRRSEGAREGAKTRERRQNYRVWQAAKRYAAEQATGPRNRCYVCGRGLSDQNSIERGIGPECWQDVLSAIQTIRSKQSEAPHAS